jgi:hypothetical protein
MACSKKGFVSEKEARTVLNQYKKHPKNRGQRFRKDKIPIRPYLCEKCGLWHFTSKYDRGF